MKAPAGFSVLQSLRRSMKRRCARSKLRCATGGVPVATFGGTGCGRKCLGGGVVGRVDLAALNTRLNTLVMQVRGGK